MAMNLLNPIQYLRATKAAIAQRTGKMGEMNYAYDVHELYAHDGVTPGGWLIGGGTPWWKETGEYNIYMSTTGSDDNDGLTAETAVATLGKAVQLASKYTCGNCIPIIYIAEGTYDIGYFIVSDYSRTLRALVIRGAGRDTTILQGMLELNNANYSVQRLTLAPRADQLSLLSGITPAFTHITACGVCSYSDIAIICPEVSSGDSIGYEMFCCDTSSFGTLHGDCKIHMASKYANAVYVGVGSCFALTGSLVLSGTCRRVFAISSYGCFYFSGSPSITGSVTGSKYWVGNFGLLNLKGQGANAIPATGDGELGDYSLVI